MTWTVGDVMQAIDAFAPFDTAMPEDNVGLLVGRMDKPVRTILTALDATPGAVLEARSLGADVLVTHHPVMFAPRNRLDEADPEAALLCDLVRGNVALIAAHTNLDVAEGGINDTLLSILGWRKGEARGFLRFGDFDSPITLAALAAQVEAALGDPVLRYGPGDKLIRRFGVCSGSGSSEVKNAAMGGAEVFLTGEIKHEKALEAIARGMAVLAAGHRATEICGAGILAKRLQLAADRVQLKIRVFTSKYSPFA